MNKLSNPPVQISAKSVGYMRYSNHSIISTKTRKSPKLRRLCGIHPRKDIDDNDGSSCNFPHLPVKTSRKNGFCQLVIRGISCMWGKGFGGYLKSNISLLKTGGADGDAVRRIAQGAKDPGPGTTRRLTFWGVLLAT